MTSRSVFVIAALLILTAAYACMCRAPLIWDGAYQFSMTLATQRPYAYLTRFHTIILWWPTVWASWYTSNPVILQAVFGLPFLLAPAVGLLGSWWVVKRDAPQLIIWVIFGVAIATLPGQIFVINDSIFQQHLFWPVFMGLFVPLTWPKRIVLGALAAFQFVHPLGVMLLLGGAIAAALAAQADRARRRSLLIGAAVMGGLCALAVAKIVISDRIPGYFDAYAHEQLNWQNAMTQWRAGVAPMFAGLCLMYAAALLVFVQPMLGGRYRLLAGVTGVGALLLAGWGAAKWCYFVRGPLTGESVYWTGALDYRRWVGPLTVPFFMLVSAEVILRARLARRRAAQQSPDHPPARRPSRGPIGILLASIFALVLGMQCMSWAQMTDRLMIEIDRYPSVIVPSLDNDLAWIGSTPLTHWTVNNYVAVMQGKEPAKMFFDTPTERLFRGDPPDARYPVNPGVKKRVRSAGDGPIRHVCPYYPGGLDQPPGPGGWYDFRPLLLRLENEPPPTRPRREKNID